jgi:hypothetical protein
MSGLPYIKVPEFGSADELFVEIFRRFFVGQAIEIATVYQEGMTVPIIETRRERRSGTMGLGTKDERFLRSAVMTVNVMCAGIDADEDAEQLSEMCYNALLEAQQNQIVIPGRGHIADIKNSSTIAREADWATSTGSVQYASLPKGTVRYETIYRVLFRPPVGGANNKFAPRP